MKSVILKAGTEQDFFQRGKTLARMTGADLPLPEERTVSFEDPAELLRLMTASRLNWFQRVKDESGSINDIAGRPHCERSAVNQDGVPLTQGGLV